MLLVQLLKTWSYITASWKEVSDGKTFFFPWKMWPELRNDLLLVITRKTWNISHYSFLLISRKMIPLSLNTFLEWRVNFCIAVLNSWGVRCFLVNHQRPGDVTAIAYPERPWIGEVSSAATWRSFWVILVTAVAHMNSMWSLPLSGFCRELSCIAGFCSVQWGVILIS